MSTFDIDFVRRQQPQRTILYFESIDSTMHAAARLAQSGCASGTAVVAGEQTAGQGRRGRSWHSEAGAGLYTTIVLRPGVTGDDLPVVTMALGLAAARAIEDCCAMRCDLRWPNDLLIGERKVCGILTQWEGRAVLAGIGINVNHSVFPPELETLATSLRIAAGRALRREDLLLALLQRVDEEISLLQQGRESLLARFSAASSYVRGKRVAVEQDGTTLYGVTDGLNHQGFLILRQDHGDRTVIVAGGVRPLS